MVGQPGAPEMYARAVSACRHCFVAKVAGHDLFGQLWPPGSAKTHQIFRADRDYARVAAAAGRTGQAIELFADFGQGASINTGK